MGVFPVSRRGAAALALGALALRAGAASGAAGLRVVTEEYPPYNYTEGGRLTGLATEVVRAVLAKVGVEAEFSVDEWQRSYDIALAEPNVLIYSIGRSAEREDLFKWVGDVAPPSRIFLFALTHRVERRQIRVASLDDARAYRIGTVAGDFRERYLVGEGFTVGRELVRGANVHVNMSDLFKAKVDLTPLPDLVGFTLARRMGLDPLALTTVLELTGIPPGANQMAFSRQTPDELVERFRAALAQVRSDGTYDRIVASYRKLVLSPEEVRRVDK
jgi:polar amino acid transport system substrate-binding protein